MWQRGKICGEGTWFFAQGGKVTAQWKDEFFLDKCCERLMPNGEVCCMRFNDFTDPSNGRKRRKWEDGVFYDSNWRQSLVTVKAAPHIIALPAKRAVTPDTPFDKWVKKIRTAPALQLHISRSWPPKLPFIAIQPSRAIVLPAWMRRRVTAAFACRLMQQLFTAVPGAEQHDEHQLQQISIFARRAVLQLVEYYFSKLSRQFEALASC